MAETFTTKLGTTSKAGERTRIWLEGKRLIAAGFTPGTHFLREWKAGKLTLRVCPKAQFEIAARDARGTVSGKGEKPIIDVVGARVRETFAGDTVTVRYSFERIDITD